MQVGSVEARPGPNQFVDPFVNSEPSNEGEKGLVLREGNTDDRRSYSLQITPKGRETLAEISTISMQHNKAMCAALSEGECEVLAGLLQRIADQQGLLHGVHPGFSSLGENAGRPGGHVPVGRKHSKTAVESDSTDD